MEFLQCVHFLTQHFKFNIKLFSCTAPVFPENSVKMLCCGFVAMHVKFVIQKRLLYAEFKFEIIRFDRNFTIVRWSHIQCFSRFSIQETLKFNKFSDCPWFDSFTPKRTSSSNTILYTRITSLCLFAHKQTQHKIFRRFLHYK